MLIAGPAGRFTLMEIFPETADCTPAELASVTLIVKVEVLAGPVGLPVIAPVEEFSANPAGSVPLLKE